MHNHKIVNILYGASHNFFYRVLILVLFLNFFSCYSQPLNADSFLEDEKENKKTSPRFVTHTIRFKTTLHCALSGKADKPMLLMIPGGSGEWMEFEELLNDSLLRNNFFMMAIDIPGKGKSAYYSDKNIAIKDKAFMIKSVLNTYKKNKKVIVLGIGRGAMVAAQLAADYPDMINRLILIKPEIDPTFFKQNIFSRNTPKEFLDAAEKLEPYLSRITQPTALLENNHAVKCYPNESYASKMLVNCKKEIYQESKALSKKTEVLKKIILKKT